MFANRLKIVLLSIFFNTISILNYKIINFIKIVLFFGSMVLRRESSIAKRPQQGKKKA